MRDELFEAGVSGERIVRCELVLARLSDLPAVERAYRNVVSRRLPTVRLLITGPSTVALSITGIGVAPESGELRRVPQANSATPAAIRVADVVWTSSLMADGSSGIERDSDDALVKVLDAVRAAGATPANIVKTFAVMSSMDDFEAFNAIYARRLRGIGVLPARTSHSVTAVPHHARVAIDAVAVLNQQGVEVTFEAPAGSPDLPFSSAVRVGDLLFISGQVGVLDVDGSYQREPAAQVRAMFALVDTIAARGGASIENFMSITAVFTDERAGEEFSEACRDHYGSANAAVFSYQVASLSHSSIVVEMDVVARLRTQPSANPDKTERLDVEHLDE